VAIDKYIKDEGYQQTKICLPCDNAIELQEEITAIENWKNQGSTSKTCSSKSFLEKQPGFDNIDLNEKGPIYEIAFQ